MHKIYSLLTAVPQETLHLPVCPCFAFGSAEGTALMKKLTVKNVSADQSGDYFQVHFDNDEPGDTEDFDIDKILNDTSDYFLIQWDLEFDDDEDEPPRYVESNDEAYIGHVTVINGSLKRNSFHLKVLHGRKTREIEITFPEQNKEAFEEAERILKIIIPNLVVM